MAACSLGGSPNVKVVNFSCTTAVMPRKADAFRLGRSSRTRLVGVAGLGGSRRRVGRSLVASCGISQGRNSTEDLVEKQSMKDRIVPGSSEVESLLTTICDTTSIAELKLDLAGFQLYVKRNLDDGGIPLPSPSPPVVQNNSSKQTPDLNGHASTTAIAIANPKPSSGGIQSILKTASDEGLVILQSPKVGFFRRSRTIKGKRAPPSCKEKQQVKEGQVLCFIEQLGGEIPIEADVSGEVIKILRGDGEPVGYGDALIVILPSFPGIKKLQ